MERWHDPTYVKSNFGAPDGVDGVVAALRQPNTNALLLLDLLPLPRFAEWTPVPLVPVGCTPSPRSFSAQVYVSATNGSAAPEHSDLGDAEGSSSS